MQRDFKPIGGWALAMALAVIAAGCGKQVKWEGSYVNTKDQSQLDLKPEHKGILKVGSISTSELTWEVAGDDKIVVHVPYPIEMYKIPDGLRDQEGTEWKKK